jgi:predicted DsbA family dithiol-disulfide isomerase
VLFENPGQLERADLERYAQELGLDSDRFGECLASDRASQIVAGDAEAASELGLTGTPVFFINGIPIRGSGPFSDFAAIVDSELRRGKPEGASPAG